MIFPKIEFDADVIRERLEVVSYLHKGVKVTFENEATGDKQVFTHEEGPGRLPAQDRRRAQQPRPSTTRRLR